MPENFDLVLKGGTVVNQDGVAERDIAVRDGRIVELGSMPAGRAAVEFDARGLHVLPGVIDSQVHFREPGAEHKEDLETGSRAAVMGGVTGVFEMPNTNPQTTTAEALADKVARGTGRMHCDFAFFVGGTAENVDQLTEFERLPGCAGVKVFIGSSTGSLLVEDDATLERILRVIRRRASFHAEDEFRLKARKGEQRPGDPSSHPVWRDVKAARLATERLLRASRRTGARVHVLHVSTADELPLLAAHRERASVEVTPQHLTFSAPEVYGKWGNLAQMNPPLREAHHAAALWRAVRSGLVDVLGSDHAPHTLEEKQKPYPQSPSGMPGVQTLVPVMLDHVNAGRLTIERFVDLTSHGPARLFGIAAKGRIAEGYDADFTVVDLKARRTITNAWMANRSNWTTFDGREVTGWPVATILRGRVVMRDGELVGPASGRPIRFAEGLPAG